MLILPIGIEKDSIFCGVFFFFLMGIQLFFILLSKILSNVGNARRYIKANYMEEGVCPDMITENCLFHLQIQNN